MRPATFFMIVPPNDANDEIVAKAVYLIHHLERIFVGYRFEVMDLRRARTVNPDVPSHFETSSRFSAVPLMGKTGTDVDGGSFIYQMPPLSLMQDIEHECEAFDFASLKGLVA